MTGSYETLSPSDIACLVAVSIFSDDHSMIKSPSDIVYAINEHILVFLQDL